MPWYKLRNMRPRSWAVNLHTAFRVDGTSLLPTVCLLCASRIEDGAGLCAACLDDLPELVTCCRRCALPLPQAGICGACLRRPPSRDESWSPLLYRPPVDGLMQSFKFNGQLAVGAWLGRFMAERLAMVRQDLPELLIPVPLHHRRLAQRGFNQALEICRPLARVLALPIDGRCCERLRPTASQTGLTDSERRRNVRAAFRLRYRPAADHVAIVDDVLTTGATTAALARALHDSGIGRVDVWAGARAVRAA